MAAFDLSSHPDRMHSSKKNIKHRETMTVTVTAFFFPFTLKENTYIQLLRGSFFQSPNILWNEVTLRRFQSDPW